MVYKMLLKNKKTLERSQKSKPKQIISEIIIPIKQILLTITI
jgi:hypothetical protein